MELYLIGSLRNPEIPVIASELRAVGVDVFDDWYAAGPHADDCWRDYEKARGHDYRTALSGWAARNVFDFDHHHLSRVDGAILCLPAGRSGHLELGYVAGLGKKAYVLLDNPERWDVMYQFAKDGIFFNKEEMLEHFKLRD
jgi:hypothetical protein